MKELDKRPPLWVGYVAIEDVPAIDHRRFRLREPAGHTITFYSSHVAGRAV